MAALNVAQKRLDNGAEDAVEKELNFEYASVRSIGEKVKDKSLTSFDTQVVESVWTAVF